MTKMLSTLSDVICKSAKLVYNPESWFAKRNDIQVTQIVEYAPGDSADMNARKENFRQRVRLATAYQSLDAYGLNEGICNHLTALAPSRDFEGKEVMLVIPYGLHWSEVTPSNLVGLNADNLLVEGTGDVEITAVCIHRGVYKARPDVRSVMHTHMPYTTALACLKDPTLEMVHQNSCRFLDRVAYDKNYGGLVQASEEGRRIGQVLGQKDVMLMGNHGAMTVGRSIAIAFDLMYYLERASLIQVLALSTGKELELLPQEVAKETEDTLWKEVDIYSEAHLAAAQRKLAKNNAEFRNLLC